MVICHSFICCDHSKPCNSPMKHITVFLLIAFGRIFAGEDSDVIKKWTEPLWQGPAPGSENFHQVKPKQKKGYLSNIHKPEIDVYLPGKINPAQSGVLICPGGGYRVLAIEHEGKQFAEWFNSKGIAAFVLKYRLPNPKGHTYHHSIPSSDARRAMRLIRHHAEKWKLNKDKIGVIGFSAGGHLASTISTRHHAKSDLKKDAIDQLNARPDFSVLVYPVISFSEKHTHRGSRTALLGKKHLSELDNYYSSEKHISTNTPPTFLVHGDNDKGVSPINSIDYYLGLKNANVASELHIYKKGQHGFGLAKGKGPIASWTERLLDWMSLEGFYKI